MSGCGGGRRTGSDDSISTVTLESNLASDALRRQALGELSVTDWQSILSVELRRRRRAPAAAGRRRQRRRRCLLLLNAVAIVVRVDNISTHKISARRNNFLARSYNFLSIMTVKTLFGEFFCFIRSTLFILISTF